MSSGMSEKKPSELVAAVAALDEELARVEQLAESAARVPLTSRRNLEKAARTTAEAATAQAKVGEHIATLMTALDGVRLRNEATVRTLQTRSDEIQAKSHELTALLERFESIGQEAREITALAQGIGGDAAAEKPASERLNELETRLGGVADGARALWEQARDGGWSDVAGDADSLRQQVLAAKNKLGLLAKRLVGPN
jgi:chromosome segregation ATPase